MDRSEPEAARDRRSPLRRAVAGGGRWALGRLGYGVVRLDPPPGREPDCFPPDADDELRELYRWVRPYTLTGVERVAALRDSIRYVSRAGIAGDICECGVWRGGSMMVVARTLVELGDVGRDLYMLDTFTRPPDPGPMDSPAAQDELDAALRDPSYSYIPVEEIRANLEATGYPPQRLRFVAGRVEDTIPDLCPARLALLRLDTDYYSSTAHEMNHLYPRLTRGGILIVDDYGDYEGCRAAVDEYFGHHPPAPLLNRIDHTGRLAVIT